MLFVFRPRVYGHLPFSQTNNGAFFDLDELFHIHRLNVSVIEKFTENVRFCLICNYLSKIIPALQSRCTRFRFGPLSREQILPRLQFVIEQEK